MRSADTISSRLRSSRDRVDQPVDGFEVIAGDEPRGAEHAQRVVGERLRRRQRRAQPCRREVDRAVERIHQRRIGQRERHRVHGEVATRQVSLDRVGERDVGLARVRVVGLGAVRRDLV